MAKINIHFLSVGDGDCSIGELPDGNLMMVDINNGRNDRSHNSDFTNPIHYLANLTNKRDIYRYIQTHPDMDHMDGLGDLVKSFNITNVWDTKNTKPKPDDFIGYRENDWDAYKNLKQTASRIIHPLRETIPVISDSGPYIYEIYPLSPTQEIIDHANSTTESWNESSFLTLLKYGNFKVIFGSDVTSEIWDEIETWVDSNISASKLLSNITIFKASHHGRESGYCGKNLLFFMNPQVIVTDLSIENDVSANHHYLAYANMDSSRNIWDIHKGNIFVDYTTEENTYNIRYN